MLKTILFILGPFLWLSLASAAEKCLGLGAKRDEVLSAQLQIENRVNEVLQIPLQEVFSVRNSLTISNFVSHFLDSIYVGNRVSTYEHEDFSALPFPNMKKRYLVIIEPNFKTFLNQFAQKLRTNFDVTLAIDPMTLTQQNEPVMKYYRKNKLLLLNGPDTSLKGLDLNREVFYAFIDSQTQKHLLRYEEGYFRPVHSEEDFGSETSTGSYEFAEIYAHYKSFNIVVRDWINAGAEMSSLFASEDMFLMAIRKAREEARLILDLSERASEVLRDIAPIRGIQFLIKDHMLWSVSYSFDLHNNNIYLVSFPFATSEFRGDQQAYKRAFQFGLYRKIAEIEEMGRVVGQLMESLEFLHKKHGYNLLAFKEDWRKELQRRHWRQ